MFQLRMFDRFGVLIVGAYSPGYRVPSRLVLAYVVVIFFNHVFSCCLSSNSPRYFYFTFDIHIYYYSWFDVTMRLVSDLFFLNLLENITSVLYINV